MRKRNAYLWLTVGILGLLVSLFRQENLSQTLIFGSLSVCLIIIAIRDRRQK